MEQYVEVEYLLEKKDLLKIELVSGIKGLKNLIKYPKIQKKGLVFAGVLDALRDDRVLIIGNTEITYFKTLDNYQLRQSLENIFSKKIPAIIITNNLKPPPELVKFCSMYNCPLFKSSLPTSELILRLTRILEDKLSPKSYVHGVMVDIHGIGTLIEGESGIGKSEIALEIVQKGHRLVADDVVKLKFLPPDFIIAEPVEELRNYIEIRGLGIINIEELFGISAIRLQKRLDLIISLIKIDENTEFDRLGLKNNKKRILGIDIPMIKLPVSPGRNIAMLIEISARIFMLKRYMNYDPTKKFIEKLYRNN